MKKKLMVGFFLTSMIIMPSMSGINKVQAADVTGVGDILTAIVDLFCPETPQRRCKNGTCQDGACVSFRKACNSDDDCSTN
jgi:hypothetical protein